ncbi:MAG TPA: SagB/ThcOx family dehydrogenase [Kiritimatiellia bacterium]|jgi:SagB-type dehydrogenase family enzyme|nr:SagB/ThcOx family dehydrogenase [Kiritimatiellia bacterium]
MNNIKISILSVGMAALALGSWAFAAERADIPLPSPRMDGGMPLLQALKQRQSARAFSPNALPEHVVADLLWAAFGINRPDTGKRTAPSARNWQEVDVFAITADGAYLYDANANVLKAVAAGDLRKLAGVQGFVGTAPLNLVFVADTARMTGSSPEDQALYAGADVGFISQNVYLFCASEGLATVVRGMVDRDALAKALNLPDHKKIILAQTVGYPGE